MTYKNGRQSQTKNEIRPKKRKGDNLKKWKTTSKKMKMEDNLKKIKKNKR